MLHPCNDRSAYDFSLLIGRLRPAFLTDYGKCSNSGGDAVRRGKHHLVPMLRVGTHYPGASHPLDGNSCNTRCYGDAATGSVEGVRDDAKRRHEVADGFDECLPRCCVHSPNPSERDPLVFKLQLGNRAKRQRGSTIECVAGACPACLTPESLWGRRPIHDRIGALAAA